MFASMTKQDHHPKQVKSTVLIPIYFGGIYFSARLTAETTARSDAVVIDVAIPAPHTVTAVPVGPVTDASTYAAA